jgi:hypothetical protein
MFWLILLVLAFLLLALAFLVEEDVLFAISIPAIFILGIFCIGTVGDGMTDYPSLLAQQSQVKAYRARIQDIRNAHYAYKKDGALVAGSIENLKQSQVLSKYINEVADLEASYAKYVQKVKFSCNSTLFWWFGTGAFIDKRVNNLPDFI